MKPLLSEYYQFIFAGHARIDLSQVSPEKQQQRRNFITTGIKEKFHTITDDTRLSPHFRRMLRQANSELEMVLYGNQEEALGLPEPGYELEDDSTLNTPFQELNTHYQFFNSDDPQRLKHFILFVNLCKIFNLYIEKSSASQEQIRLQGYKLLVWYGYSPGHNPFARFESQLITQYKTLEKPVSDSLQLDLPVNNPPIKKIEQWRRLIELYGQTAITLFQQAQVIERGLKKSKLTMESAIKQAASLRYERASDYGQLANLCYRYHCSEEMFNKCLAIRPLIKTSDQLPDILIDGKESGYRGYFLLKIPPDDPHAYLLGEISHCLQSIGAANESTVREGLLFKNNGFLILLKEKKPGAGPPLNLEKCIRYLDYDIVAHGYLWNSAKGLVVDSWETLCTTDQALSIHLLKQYGTVVLKEHPEYRLFTLGAGGKTPTELLSENPLVFLTDPMIEGKQHLNSFCQYVLAEQDLRARRDELQHRLSDNYLGLPATELAHLIAIENLYTEGQFSSVEGILFDEKMCQLIRMFEAANPLKFADFFFHDTAVFLGLLHTFKQLGLTTDTQWCCKALEFTHLSAIHTLKLLEQQTLLDKEILKQLFSSAEQFKKLTEIIHSLAVYNALNLPTLNLLRKAPTEAIRIRLQKSILILAKKGHVFADDFLLIMPLPLQTQQKILHALCLLSEDELFTTPNRRCLLANPSKANDLLKLLHCLKTILKQFIDSDYTLLQQGMDHLPNLQTATEFLVDKNQLNLITWRNLANALIHKKSNDRNFKRWLENYWQKEDIPLSQTTARHGLFISKSPSSREQDREATMGRNSPSSA